MREYVYKASLNACFMRVSCTLNRVPHKQNCWLGRVIKWRSFIRWERNFISIKLLWLGYLVYSLGNCVMKLCIDTGLISASIDAQQMYACMVHWLGCGAWLEVAVVTSFHFSRRNARDPRKANSIPKTTRTSGHEMSCLSWA